MKKLNEDISRMKTLMNINEISMVKLKTTSYPNVKFDLDGTQNDEVNQALLDDLQKAAKSAGVVATITTAKTGHNYLTKSKNVSRHNFGTAVDVAILDGIGSGGATSPNNGNAKFRELGEKLKDALVSMGYVWNTEKGNDKAVLWQTNTGGNHFNHLHISNKTGSSEKEPENMSVEPSSDEIVSKSSDDGKPSTQLSNATPNTSGQKAYYDIFSAGIGSLLGGGLNESKIYGNFGKNTTQKGDYILIPKKSNDKIKSPISGKIETCTYKSSCKNQFSIKHEIDGREYYLEFCGIENITKNSGYVSQGDTIGEMNDDVKVFLYNKRCKIESISNFLKKDTTDTKSGTSSTIPKIKKEKSYYDPLVASIFGIPKKIFSGDYPSVTGPDRNKGIFSDFFRSPTSKKVNEHIERIKRLLK